MSEKVNLRSGGVPLRFGDEDQRQAYLRQVEDARAQQTVEFAVAPGSFLRARDGRMLRGGDEVRLEDMVSAHDHDGQPTPAWRTLRSLVRDGTVLARQRADVAPAFAARFRVGT